MEYIEVTGGNPLRGSIRPAAAKNSVLPLLAATLLCAQPCTLRRVPLLRDVQTSLDLLRAVGSGAAWAGQDLVTQPARQISGRVPTALAGAMRGSVFYLAPLLTRAGWAQVCAAAECVVLRRHGVLRGTDFALRLPSVGATLTLMLAACCAAGVTTLRGAACEPEIADTAAFLNACGAKITGAGTPMVCIRGTGGELLDGCVHTVLPDRIAAATYAAAAAIAGGRVTVTQCSPVWLAAFLDFLQGSGCEVARGENEFSITRDQDTKLRGGQELVAAAYPGLATDTAPLAAAVLLGAEGASRIYDGLFQNRFACAQGFAALGADARSEGRLLYLGGSAKLHGATVTAPDLRGGAALVLAGLGVGDGSCVRVLDAGHIRRGYADLAGDLRRLGADCRAGRTGTEAGRQTKKL